MTNTVERFLNFVKFGSSVRIKIFRKDPSTTKVLFSYGWIIDIESISLLEYLQKKMAMKSVTNILNFFDNKLFSSFWNQNWLI